MNSSIDGTPGNQIAPQPFNLMIALATINIALSYSYFFCSENLKTIVYCLMTILCTIVLFYFKAYLQNFKADKAIHLVNWYMVTGILLLLYTLSEKIFISFKQHHALFSVVSMLLFGTIILVSVRLGNLLRKIENDYVGMIKKLGYSFTYLFPMVVLLMLLFPESSWHNIPFEFVENTIFVMPTLIMTLIFYKAKKLTGKPLLDKH